MGNRALIQVEGADGVSPVLYLHWADEPQAIIDRTKKRLEGRKGDVDYAFARLVQQAMGDDKGDTGVGVFNKTERLTPKDSHGDEGVFIYNCDTGETEHFD
jgi:hypothetical protein